MSEKNNFRKRSDSILKIDMWLSFSFSVFDRKTFLSFSKLKTIALSYHT